MQFRRWICLARKVWDSNFSRLRLPYKLLFVITKECHSKCLNCNIWQVKPQNELTLEEIQQLARNSPFLSWVDFTGGEPTDRKDFVEIVKAFVDHCPELLFVHFPTNGLKPERIAEYTKALLKFRIPRLVASVSIDGPKDVNDRLRGIPGDFDRALDTLQRLRTFRGLQTYVGMTLYPENVGLVGETLSAIQKTCPGFDYRDLHVNLPHTSTHYYGNSTASPTPTEQMSNEQMIATLETVIKKRGVPRNAFDVIELLYQSKVRQYVASGLCPSRCASLMASCYLAETGMVYPCNIWSEPLGNIRDHGLSLVPLIQSRQAEQLREKIVNHDCPNCWTPCEAYQTLAANLVPFVGRTRKGSLPSQVESAVVIK